MTATIAYLLAALLAGPAEPVPEPAKSPDAAALAERSAKAFKFRSIGPAVTSGRVVGLAVHPRDASTYYVAVASGGVWKTTNAGTTFTPVFDAQSSYSIGCVQIDPKRPETVWVGTGENNSQRSVGYGDGVYKSVDGGKSWKNVGLGASEHVARILIDPRDSDDVLVAAQGPLWNAGGERGLYRTRDGGKTWACVLAIDADTGVTDVVRHPADPDVLLAASYQRRRHVYTLVNGGPGSAVHRSTDGGKTWAKIGGGLPGGELGRIGLAAASSKPGVAYATVEAPDKLGGIFRSEDFGLTWAKQNPFDTQAQYYAHIVVDPIKHDRIYVMNVRIMTSDDGGKTLAPLGDRFKHVDNHCIWVNPADPNHVRVGCDGGLYTSFDGAKNWLFHENLPVTQFYDVAVDQNPASGRYYHVYGGTQDNFTLGGPVRSRSVNGVANADWHAVQGGDGFHCAVDPSDPDTVYAESQYGGLCRYDRKTGTRVDIQPVPAPGEPPLRWNWDSPMLVSAHDSKRVYFAANKLFVSGDRGDNWAAISPDLTRQLDRDRLPVFGKVPKADAVSRHVSTSFYGNCTALAESPKEPGTLVVGTDDGLIQVTTDDGKTWRKLDSFAGVPERTYVSKLVCSRHDSRVVYAAFDAHKNGDFKPYLLKSSDGGATWTSLAAGLPARGTVYALAEDHIDPNLLFCGTEFGLFVTRDGGKSWAKFMNGIPTIQVKDIVVQRACSDLVVATFGRGFYVLDDYSGLRSLTPDLVAKPAALVGPGEVTLAPMASPLGGSGNGFLGAARFSADNPPMGAGFLVHLKDSIQSRKDKRREAEKKAEAAKADVPVTKPEDLRAEAEEEKDANVLVVTDSDQLTRRLVAVPSESGLHRVEFDLRESGLSSGDDLAGGGPYLLPGTYTVTLARRSRGQLAPLAEPVRLTIVADPLSKFSAADAEQSAAFAKSLRATHRRLEAMTAATAATLARLEQARAALESVPPSPARGEVRAAIEAVRGLQRDLSGDAILAERNQNVPLSVQGRLREARGANASALARPTGTQVRAVKDVGAELDRVRAALAPVAEGLVPKLEAQLEAAGAPLPTGRLPK